MKKLRNDFGFFDGQLYYRFSDGWRDVANINLAYCYNPDGSQNWEWSGYSTF